MQTRAGAGAPPKDSSGEGPNIELPEHYAQRVSAEVLQEAAVRIEERRRARREDGSEFGRYLAVFVTHISALGGPDGGEA